MAHSQEVQEIIATIHEPHREAAVAFLDHGHISSEFEKHLNSCASCQEGVDKLCDWMRDQLDA